MKIVFDFVHQIPLNLQRKLVGMDNFQYNKAKSEKHCPDKYFYSDAYEDDTSQDRGLTGKACTEVPAQDQTAYTDDKGDGSNDAGSKQGHAEAVAGYGKTDGKRIDGGSNSLDQHGSFVKPGAGFSVFLPIPSLHDHFASDIDQKEEGNPGYKYFKKAKITDDGVDTDPSGHRH